MTNMTKEVASKIQSEQMGESFQKKTSARDDVVNKILSFDHLKFDNMKTLELILKEPAHDNCNELLEMPTVKFPPLSVQHQTELGLKKATDSILKDHIKYFMGVKYLKSLAVNSADMADPFGVQASSEACATTACTGVSISIELKGLGILPCDTFRSRIYPACNPTRKV